jgi:hypothetical protein
MSTRFRTMGSVSILQSALKRVPFEANHDVVGLLLEYGADVSRLDRDESRVLSELAIVDGGRINE